MKNHPSFPALLEGFFTDRLVRQRQASPHTVASYRDTFCLLLRFAQKELGKAPSDLTLEELDAPFLTAFLEHLERERGNSTRTRNVRLAAIHSFYRYAALLDPAHSALIDRVLAIPTKRCSQRPVDFLNPDETDALLKAPDRSTWYGRRDRTLLLLAVQTGLRLSELIALRVKDVVLEGVPHVRCHGKGRKDRITPLREEVVAALGSWLREHGGEPEAPLFPSNRRGPLSPDAVQLLVRKHAEAARQRCPSLGGKRVTPHVLRHTAAMDLLRNRVDRSVIALWLGHESPETTSVYLHADLRIKEEALARTTPRGVKPGRYRPDDALLSFLTSL